MSVIKINYKPHPKQLRFHRCDARYKLFLAGIGCGKTLAGVYEAMFQCDKNPGFDGCIVSPTYSMLRDVVVPLWQENIPKQLYTYLKKDQIFELWTGQKIFLRTGERPDAIRGLNLAWIWGDELAMVQNKELWSIMQGRVGRTTHVPNPCIYATTTPKGWNWLAKKFLRNADPRFYRTIRARSSDNPYMPREFIDSLRADYGEEFAKQELDAEIIESSGLCWPVFPNLHCDWNYKDDIGHKGFKRVVGGVDWGFSNPASIIIAGKTRDNEWYVVEEWYKKGKLPEEIYDQMRKMKVKWGVKVFHCDSAEPARIKEANTKGLPCKPCKKGKGSINRGVQEVRQLLAIRGKTKRPSLFIHPKCKWLLKEMEDYHYDDDSEAPIGESGDHACDAVRYIFDAELNESRIRGVT